MAQYFFKMTQAEKNNILDQHKSVYDGYVTEYAKESNQTPLYVQDFANDKEGLVVSNKGVVKAYTNMGINEDIDRRDRIGDGPMDLKNGTVDLSGEFDMLDDESEMMHDEYPSPNEDEVEYISLGSLGGECNECGDKMSYEEMDEDYEYDIDRDTDEDMAGPMNFEVDEDMFKDETDEENLPDLMESINESLDMFRRFKKYN